MAANGESDVYSPMNAIVRNIGLKVVALSLALLLWFHVVTNHEYDLTLDYELDYVDIPSLLVLAVEPPSTVGVRVKGEGKQLLQLWWRGDRRWPISLARATIGDHPVELRHSNVPRFGIENIEVLDILMRGEWSLTLDSLGEKMVPVYTTERFAAAEQYIPTGPVTVTPDSVRLIGPARKLMLVDSIAIAELGGTGWEESVDQMIAVTLPVIHNTTVMPDSVRVLRPIERFVSLQFDSLPVAVVQPDAPPLVRVQPAFVTVSVGGPESWIAHLVSDSIRVVYAAGRDDANGARAPLWVNVSPPFEILEVRPDSIIVIRDDLARSDSGN